MFINSLYISGDVNTVTKQRLTQSTASVSDPKLMGGLNGNPDETLSLLQDSYNTNAYSIRVKNLR